MAIDKTDLSFKKLVNRKFTTVTRSYSEEVGDTTLEVDSTGIYVSNIPNTTSSAYSLGVAREIKCVLTKDYQPSIGTSSFYVISGSGYSVDSNNYNSTFAAESANFFVNSSSFVQKNFLSPKFGSEYTVILRNSSGTQIYPSDPINWYFDYKTGIVSIANPENKTLPQSSGIPYSITASQYIGSFLDDVIVGNNITASNISASGIISGSTIRGVTSVTSPIGNFTNITASSINKIENFLGLNTSSFGIGTATNERSKTTDDLIYTSGSVNYLLHVHHQSASLQIYNLQTQNLVSNVSLTSGKNPNSLYLEGNKVFVGCYGSGSIATVDISNINSPTTTYTSSLGSTSYTDDTNIVNPIVFKGNFIFGNITNFKIYDTSSVSSLSSTSVGSRISALHAYTSASVDVLLVLGYGIVGTSGSAFIKAYNITYPSSPSLISSAPVINTVMQPLPTEAERLTTLAVDSENKYVYVGDSTSSNEGIILRVFDLSDLNHIKTIAEVKLNSSYYPYGTPVIRRVSLTSYDTVLVTDHTNKRTFEFDLYDIKNQNNQLVVPIKIYTFDDNPTSVKFFENSLSEDIIVVSTLNNNIYFQNKSNKFIISSTDLQGTNSKNSILSLNNFTANISGNLIVSNNINCKTTIKTTELQFPNYSKIKSDSNYIRTLSSDHVIMSEPTNSYNAAFYNYCVYSGSNVRAGIITAAFLGGTVSYNETVTSDIGNTNQLTMSVGVNGDSIQLLSNASTNVSWSIKAIAKYI